MIDHGEGIPPQIRDKIFQRFWRADTSRTRDTGRSGLGLAIVAAIVSGHGGTSASARPGRRSHLPRHASSASTPDDEPEAEVEDDAEQAAAIA